MSETNVESMETPRRGPGRPPRQAPMEPSEIQSDSPRTVTVACKLPMGLALRLGHKETVNVPMMGGGYKEQQEWRPDGEIVYIKGTGNKQVNGDPRSPIADDYALTFGVSREFMERWFEENRSLEVVQRGLIFFHENGRELKAMTHDNREQKTGLEPMAQNNDPRVPRALGQKVEKMNMND